jgi:dTDP-L-rhamnose 4-epimerase
MNFKRNILVTGGAGFIGSRLVHELHRANGDCSIWVLDNLHPQIHGANALPPEFPEKNVRFVLGDITDQKILNEVLLAAQPELIYHLAAETGTGQSFDELSRYCEVNVTGTARLIEAVRAHAPDAVRRIVLASSRAVYGEGAYVDAEGREFVGPPRNPEEMALGRFEAPLPKDAKPPLRPAPSHSALPPAPASVYASTKLMQEYLVRQAGEGASWKATILRFQNVYGPGQSLRNPYTGVLSIFAHQLLSGRTLSIFEDGDIARDFVYVDDVVRALAQAGQRDLPHGEIIDIGSGIAYTILDVARLLMRALGRRDDAFAITGQFRVGDIRHARADITRAQALLDYRPQVDIASGLQLLGDWCRQEFTVS